MARWGAVAAGFRAVFSRSVRRAVAPGTAAFVAGTAAVCYHRHARDGTRPFSVQAEEQRVAAAPPPSARRVRFTQFASVVHEDEPYMTPRDFLFSVMLERVDRKLQKKTLTDQEVNKMLLAASNARASRDLFRALGDDGLISYTEYLFLLTILIKPRVGFHIAFKMLDVDGNKQVDKKEFLKLKKIIGKTKVRTLKDSAESPAEDTEGVNTTLQAYFFGRKGESKLHYQEFCRFMEDLQVEVQEMEFLRFSKGMDTMRREDFAEWLLHYTDEDDNEVYWENMRKRIPSGQSITFEEFRAFCLFTNNLDDFAFSVKMLTEANRPVGMVQFKRAVRIATGSDLSDNVLDTVFKLFDTDGDNCLSHKEFIGVMKDRVLRGLKVPTQNGLSGYWKCVKRETLGDTRCPI